MSDLLNLADYRENLAEQIRMANLSDCILPNAFKNVFKSFGDYNIDEYYEYTLKVSSRKSVCYIPNQWIYIAAICSKYCIELKKYKNKLRAIGVTDEQFEICHPSSSDKTIPNSHKENSYLENKAQEFLSGYNGEDKEFLVSFLWNYDSWGGGKNIKRDNDFMISPCLNLANSINASSSLIGDISKAIAEDSSILDILLNSAEMKMINSLSTNVELSPVILYGPPGTGKTYKMQKDYISKFADDDRKVTTFHQSFSYEEFVEGLKPVMDSDVDSEIKYRIEDGIFKQACERAAQLAGFENLKACLNTSFEDRNLAFSNAVKAGHNVLLCIDEINRGNVAAIFGDLISLIESDKRLGSENEMTVKLPYSKEEFGVPANLLIVGTMNTADRSIQLLDTALRRRFKFKELLPQYDEIKNENAVTILKNINARIRCLLNKDNQIGHAYFIHAKNDSEIFSIMINKVIPLLEEYFYNDTEKIRFVLNEDGNVEKSFYIEDEEAKAVYNLYNKEGIDEDKSFYVLNEELKKLSDEDKCSEFLANLLNK